MHTNGLFLVRVKIAALPGRPIAINNLLEPVEVKGKKKSKLLMTHRGRSKGQIKHAYC